MVVQAQTQEGNPVRIEFHPILSWVLGIAAVLITTTIIGSAVKLVDLETRVTAIESSRVRPDDLAGYTTHREFDGHVQAFGAQLSRIETKLDAMRQAR